MILFHLSASTINITSKSQVRVLNSRSYSPQLDKGRPLFSQSMEKDFEKNRITESLVRRIIDINNKAKVTMETGGSFAPREQRSLYETLVDKTDSFINP